MAGAPGFPPGVRGQATGTESPYERPQEGRSGYPEEQPAGVADEPQRPSEETPQRKGGPAERKYAASDNEDEGTAIGNPLAAGRGAFTPHRTSPTSQSKQQASKR